MKLEAATFAIEHVMLRLRGLNRALRAAVEHQRRAAERFARPGMTVLCVTDEQVAALLEDIEALAVDGNPGQPSDFVRMDSQEIGMQEKLRAVAMENNAKLPFDVLTEKLGLLPFEETAVLVCAAPELDRSYGRIYGYILDDLNRQQACVELICLLAAQTTRERLILRRALGRFGHLRRAGILQPLGEAAIEARQELRLAPAIVDYLLGAKCDPASIFRDRADVVVPADVELPRDINSAAIERLAKSISEKRVSVVGVWGPRHCGKEELLLAVAKASGSLLRRFNPATGQSDGDFSQSVWQAVLTASALDAILWVETDKLQGPEQSSMLDTIVEAIANSSVPVFLTGTHPWRPERILAARRYVEFELAAPDFQMRRSMWLRTLPEVIEPQISKLAGRFRLSRAEMHAAAQLARTSAELNGNGHQAEMACELEAACATVTRRRSDHFATAIKPRRTAEDLVLPDDVHKQVIEIARFFRSTALVDEEWGFGRMASGGGIKVLFTGEPGTGKTLGAEVIAGIIGLPLLKVDLARVVSKWVGETEKNLDTVFREAEESHAVLFFDEADSLFGKRGEVQHGTDRYANLEVGFLLQRLEDYFGLVILASNLKDQIDPAFTRRFHVIVHFPLPRAAERRRIWKLAFPPGAPIEPTVDFDMLQQLDMTGAAIVSAARTAALLAADEDSSSISMAHVVRGVARQFRREARILAPAALGSYGSLLHGAP